MLAYLACWFIFSLASSLLSISCVEGNISYYTMAKILFGRFELQEASRMQSSTETPTRVNRCSFSTYISAIKWVRKGFMWYRTDHLSGIFHCINGMMLCACTFIMAVWDSVFCYFKNNIYPNTRWNAVRVFVIIEGVKWWCLNYIF